MAEAGRSPDLGGVPPRPRTPQSPDAGRDVLRRPPPCGPSVLQMPSDTCRQTGAGRSSPGSARSPVSTVVGKLPWGHVRTLLDQLDDPNLRDWYAEQDVSNAGPGRSYRDG